MRRILGAIALAILVVGCGAGRQVQRGADKYTHADYGAAMTQWRYLEEREDDLNDKGRVRYLVYRGLTHYRLYQQARHPGEHAGALHYLARGKQAYDAGKAGWLDAKTVVEMKDALADLTGQVPVAAGQVVVVQLPPPPQTVIVPLAQPAPQPAPAPVEEEESGWD